MKLDYRMGAKRMMLCALFALCAMVSRAANAAPERERRLPAAYGEQRRFSASSLPKVGILRLPAEMAGQAPTVVPTVGPAAPQARADSAAVHVAIVGPTSDIGPYLRARSPLADSERFLNRAEFSSLIPAIRRPLKADHAARTVERNGMLPEADWIDDSVNNRLGPWKGQLDANLEKLDKETESYKTEVGLARSKCMPARDEATWQWCLKEKTRLEEWRVSLFNRGEAHNADLAKFHLQSKPYDSRLAALFAKIESWEIAVNELIARIKKALNEKPDTQILTCTNAQHDKLQKDVNDKCDGEVGEKRACKGDQECDALHRNLAKNQACYAARKLVVDECYGGQPNSGHKKAIEDALTAINACLNWIKKRCGGVGVGSAPL